MDLSEYLAVEVYGEGEKIHELRIGENELIHINEGGIRGILARKQESRKIMKEIYDDVSELMKELKKIGEATVYVWGKDDYALVVSLKDKDGKVGVNLGAIKRGIETLYKLLGENLIEVRHSMEEREKLVCTYRLK